MRTKDILKQAIKDFNGTVIVVSHDREFLDGLVEKVYEFGGGKVRECLGGIYEFLEKKKLDNLQQLEMSRNTNSTDKDRPQTKAQPQNKTTTQNAPAPTVRKLSYAEQREREKSIRRMEKKVCDAEKQINDIETEIAGIEARISSGDVTPEIFTEHQKKIKELENAMSVWELASMELETFRQE